jgi:hypothetical protein
VIEVSHGQVRVYNTQLNVNSAYCHYRRTYCRKRSSQASNVKPAIKPDRPGVESDGKSTLRQNDRFLVITGRVMMTCKRWSRVGCRNWIRDEAKNKGQGMLALAPFAGRLLAGLLPRWESIPSLREIPTLFKSYQRLMDSNMGLIWYFLMPERKGRGDRYPGPLGRAGYTAPRFNPPTRNRSDLNLRFLSG